MGPAKVRIYFDSPTACYSPGERIKGKVVLILDREKQIIGKFPVLTQNMIAVCNLLKELE
jgi:hypothetical protein